jgi:hypothetical protein
LPQFVNPGAEPMGQLVLLYTALLVIAIVLDGTWALTADRFGRVLALNSKLRNRLTGGLLVSAGLGLALVRKSSRLCENAHLKELGRGSVTVNLNFFANWLLSMVEAL